MYVCMYVCIYHMIIQEMHRERERERERQSHIACDCIPLMCIVVFSSWMFQFAWSLGCGCLSLRCTLRTRLKAYEAEVEELRAERGRLVLGYYLDVFGYLRCGILWQPIHGGLSRVWLLQSVVAYHKSFRMIVSREGWSGIQAPMISQYVLQSFVIMKASLC